MSEHGPDWTGSLPGEPPSCRCGYNGTPEDCAANRAYDGMLRWLAVQEQANELQRAYPDWRRGQALFNALHAMHAELADAIRGTNADPFHNGSRERVEAFAEAVIQGGVQ